MPKLVASLFHNAIEATAAPVSPIAPSGAIGIRSPGLRKASANITAMAVAVRQQSGTMARYGWNMKFTIADSQFAQRFVSLLLRPDRWRSLIESRLVN